MCVIIYKPKNTPLPSVETIRAAYRANHDGCGIVSPTVYYKGLSFNTFMKHFKRCSEKEPLLIHFRWATTGAIKKSNCHPFFNPETGVFFMHNGVLPIEAISGKTDSETAFIEQILPSIKKYGYGSEEFKQAVYGCIHSSKFAFMQGDDVKLFGAYAHMNGCYYSNLRFTNYMFHF